MTTRTDTPETSMVHGGTPILADVRRRFGGIDTPAAIVGALTAIGVIAFLTALLAAGSASIAFQMDLIDTEGAFSDLDAAGFVVALGVVFVGFLVGGWAAGRMARYDGGKNGLAAAFWMLVLIVGFAAAGALISEEYNAFATTDLPDWMSQVAADDATAVGIAAAAIAVVVMFLGGWLGGRLGETYHHHIDAAVAHAARHPESTRDPEDRSGHDTDRDDADRDDADRDDLASHRVDDDILHAGAVALDPDVRSSDSGISDAGDSDTGDWAAGDGKIGDTATGVPALGDSEVDAEAGDPTVVDAEVVEVEVVEVATRDDETVAGSRMRAPNAGERDATRISGDNPAPLGATGIDRDENSPTT